MCPSSSDETVASLKYGPGDPKAGQWRLADQPYRIDDSYAYFGWALDLTDDTPENTGTVSQAAPLLATALPLISPGASIDGSTQAAIQFAQMVEGFAKKFYLDGNRKAAQEDIAVPAGGGPANYGNGRSGTLYRLREGVERFMITDINNPAGSSLAQSALPIEFDTLGSAANIGLFNHIPGGCNVLYMDGHVDFVKYPGKGPITRPMATVVGAVKL